MRARARSTTKIVTSVTSGGITHVRTTSTVCEDGDCRTDERVDRIVNDEAGDGSGRVVQRVVQKVVQQVSNTTERW